MHIPRKYLHDRLILALLSAIAVLVVLGVASVLLRFDASKNQITITSYRPSVSGIGYVSGRPIDIYGFAMFMAIIATANIILSIKAFPVRHYVSLFILGGTVFLLAISIIVANALISLQ